MAKAIIMYVFSSCRHLPRIVGGASWSSHLSPVRPVKSPPEDNVHRCLHHDVQGFPRDRTPRRSPGDLPWRPQSSPRILIFLGAGFSGSHGYSSRSGTLSGLQARFEFPTWSCCSFWFFGLSSFLQGRWILFPRGFFLTLQFSLDGRISGFSSAILFGWFCPWFSCYLPKSESLSLFCCEQTSWFFDLSNQAVY